MSIFEPNTPEQQQKPEKLYFEDGLKYYSQTKTREEIEAEIRVMLHAAGSPSASITIEDGNSSTRLAYRRLVGLVDKGVLLSGKAPMPGTTRPVNHFWLNPDGPIASIETPRSGASDDSGRKHA